MLKIQRKQIGQVGYEAYAKSTGGKTFDGRDMPKWEQLPSNIQNAWNEAGKAIKLPFNSRISTKKR